MMMTTMKPDDVKMMKPMINIIEMEKSDIISSNEANMTQYSYDTVEQA